ncbi:MAG: hypothetical protein R3C25_05035 [Hyphomonadaceae bacterium]
MASAPRCWWSPYATERLRFLGVERDRTTAALASRENVALNAMSARVEIAAGDALDRAASWGVFDGVSRKPAHEAEGRGGGLIFTRVRSPDRSLTHEWWPLSPTA